MNSQIQHWVRFAHAGTTGFGTLGDDLIQVHAGDMFTSPEPTGQTLALDAVRLLMPAQPSKVIALWNNTLHWARSSSLRCRPSRFTC